MPKYLSAQMCRRDAPRTPLLNAVHLNLLTMTAMIKTTSIVIMATVIILLVAILDTVSKHNSI